MSDRPTMTPMSDESNEDKTVVRRGDKFVSIDQRFDQLERRVLWLTILILIEVFANLPQIPVTVGAILKVFG